MIALSEKPLDTTTLRAQLEDRDAGALVIFEGRVRRRNSDREVMALLYEASDDIAQNEFRKIAAEARANFDILGIACAHRTGRLGVGDVAVWIGVTAEHRADAFDACRYLIDEIKKRLPIWKKEFYEEGDSDWITGS